MAQLLAQQTRRDNTQRLASKTRIFGALPELLQQRIQTATSAQLETWSLNILDATTLDEVFTN